MRYTVITILPEANTFILAASFTCDRKDLRGFWNAISPDEQAHTAIRDNITGLVYCLTEAAPELDAYAILVRSIA